jgi:hypothetical protein
MDEGVCGERARGADRQYCRVARRRPRFRHYLGNLCAIVRTSACLTNGHLVANVLNAKEIEAELRKSLH